MPSFLASELAEGTETSLKAVVHTRSEVKQL